MRKALDFLLGCFAVPSFILTTFLIYLKLFNYASLELSITLVDLVKYPTELFGDFINNIYRWAFIAPIEFIVAPIFYVFRFFGVDINFRFPEWYPTAAYFSTILYGAQLASMKLFSPVAGNSTFDNSQSDLNLGDWKSATVSLMWNMILIIYIPINRISRFIIDSWTVENLSGKRLSRIFKTIVLGFLMIGFLFLIHDLLLMFFGWKSESDAIRQHKRFHLALLISFTTAIIFTAVSLIVFNKNI